MSAVFGPHLFIFEYFYYNNVISRDKKIEYLYK